MCVCLMCQASGSVMKDYYVETLWNQVSLFHVVLNENKVKQACLLNKPVVCANQVQGNATKACYKIVKIYRSVQKTLCRGSLYKWVTHEMSAINYLEKMQEIHNSFCKNTHTQNPPQWIEDVSTVFSNYAEQEMTKSQDNYW